MPSFQYKAVDRTGGPARGALEAANEVDLELRLRRMGLDLITCRPVEKGSSVLSRGNISRQDLITFCFDLEQISRAGIPLLEGLLDLRDAVENPRFREVLTTMLEDMDGGKVLSQCLAAHPDVFDEVFVSLIGAGEQTGRLAEVFESLGASIKWQDELAGMTKRLMIYPFMLLLVVGAVIVFLLTYLVPQLSGLFKTMGTQLPMQTRALIAVSDGLVKYWFPALAVPAVVAAALAAWIKSSPRARYLWDYAKLRLPVFGPILQKIILARFASFFAMMYQSGITVLEAIKTSEGIVGNRVIADGLRRAGVQINAGESLTETFRNLGMFPPLVIRMLRVGENTGALDTALLNVNYFYTRDVKDGVDKAIKLLGPAMTMALGGAMAFIMWAVLSPVYDILGKMKF